MTKQHPLEFIAIGHVTIDRVGDERRLGGAAAYASLAARHLGVKTGLVTSAGPEFPYWDRFAGIHTKTIDAAHTTELEHRYREGERQQYVHQVASVIRAEHLAELELVEDAAVLYCPVVHELETPLTRLTSRGLAAVAPQGFFRKWDDEGRITAREWDDAERALARADVVCLSEKDTDVPEELAEGFAGTVFVITKGSNGCRVYAGSDIFDFPALPASEVDATGAGDVFAAALVIGLRRGDAISHATRFAMREAAAAVEHVGTEGFREPR